MKAAVATALALALAAGACLGLPGYYAYLVGMVATTAIVGVGLNVLLGLAGEISLGQAGFLALGAYGVGVLTTGAGWGFWAAWPVAIGVVVLVAALLSLPALRVSGSYLAMVTIAFGFIVEAAEVEWRGLTGGASGIEGVGAPFGVGGTALLACVCCAAALAGFAWLAGSPLGLAMRAAATAPAAARSVGIGPLPVRTAAFVLAAALAGLAGGLQAALTGFIAPSSFPFSQSILFLLVVIVGGAGATLGPLLGAILVGLLPEVLASLAEYRQLVFGAGLLVVLLVAPGGLAGLLPRRRAAGGGASSNGAAGANVAGFLARSAGAGLRLTGLGVAFGGVRAVDGVAFTAAPGRITSVIGPNGAGKTTLLNLISGFQRPSAGTVHVGDLALTGLAAQQAGRAGIARSFQTAQMFDGMTVLDCVRTGLLRGAWRGTADPATARALLAFAGFTGNPDGPAAALPHPARRLVELARALATRPAVLLLDEPAAGLDAADTASLAPVLRRIAGCGIAVVLVEHDMGLVMGVSDHICVLDAGRLIAEGTPAHIRGDSRVRAAYLGEAAAPRAARPPGRPGAPLLETAGLHAGYGAIPVLRDVSLGLARGEMLAIIGPNGAGKSTLMRALSGLLRPVRGQVRFAGRDIEAAPAHAIAAAGLVLVPEGRQVFPGLTVAENMRLGATRRRDFRPDEIAGMLDRFPRLRPLLGRPAGLLSGGEQQMLAIARGLLAKPEVLLLDEPSLGLAPAIATELFDALARLRDEGLTLVLVDQMAELALPLADRCVVLGGGQVVRAGPAAAMREGLENAYLGSGVA